MASYIKVIEVFNGESKPIASEMSWRMMFGLVVINSLLPSGIIQAIDPNTN